MKCLKCNSSVIKSQFSSITGYDSYRCSNKECNYLYDGKELFAHSQLQEYEDLLNDKKEDKGIKVTMSVPKNRSLNISSKKTLSYQQQVGRMVRPKPQKIYMVDDNDFAHLLSGGFHGGRVYSFIESSSSYARLSHFIINEIVKNNNNYILIDPLDISSKIEKLYNIKLNSYKPNTIEEAYTKILEEEKNEKLILFLDMDVLVSEDLVKDPHRKVVGLNSRVHKKYLQLLSTNMNKNSSLVLFATAMDNMKPIGNTRIHPISMTENISYESYILGRTGVKVIIKDRKSRKNCVLKKAYK
jgi:hypothetical protein